MQNLPSMTNRQMERELRRRPSIFPSRQVSQPFGPLMAHLSIQMASSLAASNYRRMRRLELTPGERAARRLQLRKELGK